MDESPAGLGAHLQRVSSELLGEAAHRLREPGFIRSPLAKVPNSLNLRFLNHKMEILIHCSHAIAENIH